MPTINGTSGNDTLTGTGGDDILNGRAGDDLLDGGPGGTDRLNGDDGNDTVDYRSSAGAVQIYIDGQISWDGVTMDFFNSIENATGSAFDDVLIGDAGDNVLDGGPGGVDHLSGGGGSDTASYASASTAVVIYLDLQHSWDGLAMDFFDSIENAAGSGFDDIIFGSDGANVLSGGAGNDRLSGNDGDDLISGGAGSDVMDGGAGSDTLSYESETGHVLVNLSTGETAFNASGDVISNFENLRGSDFNDVLTGSAGANVIDGRGGGDNIHAGAGDDLILSSAGNDQNDGGDDFDTISYANQAGGVVVLVDGSGQSGVTKPNGSDALVNIEKVVGSAFDDLIIWAVTEGVADGGAGNDRFIDGIAIQHYFGGIGTDTIELSSSPNGVTVNLTLGTGAGGFAEGDTYSGIENIVGSDHDDVLTGDAGDNAIDGRAGDDRLDGGAGGVDRLNGNIGNDTVSYDSALAGMQIYLDSHVSWDGSSQDSLISIENAIGSPFDDVIWGDAGNNILSGGGGGTDHLFGAGGLDTVSYLNSTLAVDIDLAARNSWDGATMDFLDSIENAIGSSHDDVLTGDAANNILDGGPGGVDFLSGGGGSDTASYVSSLTGVHVDLASRNGWDGSAMDFFDSIENAIGSGYDDVLVGDAGDNILDGGPGGSDFIDGGGGSDMISYASSLRAVHIELGPQTGWDGAAADFFTSIENALGSRFDDVINGDASANLIDGGGGEDLLYGGAGADIFRFSAVLDGSLNVASLRDFGDGGDSIQLDHNVFSALSPGALSSGAFVSGSHATTAGQHIIFDPAFQSLFYDPDGSGPAAQLLFAVFERGGSVAIDQTDFVVI
jgi:Ca2+-binding RTX toxin-like protein